MSSTSEVGHAKNVSNFEDLIAFCTAYGAAYNPSKAALNLRELTALHSNAKTQITTVATAKNTFDTLTGDRQLLFEPLKPLATRVFNALSATDATEQNIADAKSINNKLQGIRVKKIEETPVEDAPKHISVSRQSYDSLIENFSAFTDLVSSIPSYIPNETELTTPALTTYLEELQTSNTNLLSVEVAYSNTRISRNETLYNEKTGLVALAADIKKYIKSIFGATSPQYKQVSSLKFTKRED